MSDRHSGRLRGLILYHFIPMIFQRLLILIFWGKVPEGAKEKQVVDGMRMACLEV